MEEKGLTCLLLDSSCNRRRGTSLEGIMMYCQVCFVVATLVSAVSLLAKLRLYQKQFRTSALC